MQANLFRNLSEGQAFLLGFCESSTPSFARGLDLGLVALLRQSDGCSEGFLVARGHPRRVRERAVSARQRGSDSSPETRASTLGQGVVAMTHRTGCRRVQGCPMA